MPIIRRAGGICRTIQLQPPQWNLDVTALAAAFSEKTKLLVLNSPQNPASKVYRQDELEAIAKLAQAHDVVVVCDEAYEHIVYDDHCHTPLMTLPGMAERVVKIGSAGKTFSVTGWKVGYITTHPNLLAPIAKAHQFLVFTTAPNLQRAVAFGLTQDDDYFDNLATTLASKRDRLSRGLVGTGLKPINCAGTYFLFADFAELDFDGDDVAFCTYLTTEVGVTAVPVSAFYSQNGAADTVRFCFSKQDDVLDAAVDRLRRHFT
jgi:aspartate/methionine/tyrosine aminotransferase